MELDTKTPPYMTSDRKSFAYVSAIDRWPKILTGAIDDVHRTTSACKEGEEKEEGKKIVEQLATLKHELQHDRALIPVLDDGQQDVAGYNKELEQLGPPTWFNVPWLFGECYLYRRINTFFALTKLWKEYDVFARQKRSTFKSSRPAVVELAARYKEILSQLESTAAQNLSAEEQTKAEQLLFTEMCEICLWGNATDLSLLTSLTYEDIQKVQGAKARKESEKNILINDLPKAYEILRTARSTLGSGPRRVDIVLDNAGFELYVDLVLAGYLLAAGLATEIVLHPKSFPWFVSDVLPKDFADLLNMMADPQAFYTGKTDEEDDDAKAKPPLTGTEADEIALMFKHWSELYSDGKLIIRPNRFWTHAGSFWRLPKIEPALHEDLKESELVIFKGDLNYRKLTGDAAWDTTTPFVEAIGPLGAGSGVRILSLRTCKADVVVGLPEGENERLMATKDGGADIGARKWTWGGQWAVVTFNDGKK